MILNEYRLMPWQKEAQELIGRHMEDFFFGAGAALPSAARAERLVAAVEVVGEPAGGRL